MNTNLDYYNSLCEALLTESIVVLVTYKFTVADDDFDHFHQELIITDSIRHAFDVAASDEMMNDGVKGTCPAAQRIEIVSVNQIGPRFLSVYLSDLPDDDYIKQTLRDFRDFTGLS